MPLLANARLAAQLNRETQELFYGDSSFLYRETVNSYDDYGQPVTSTTTFAFDCSFTDKVSKERWLDYADVAEFVAEIRFQEPEPNKGDRVQLSDRFDSEYTDKTYEVAGIRDRGTFGYVCALKEVEI
jgi:hypothetical protein